MRSYYAVVEQVDDAIGILIEELEKEGWHFVEWGDEQLAQVLKKIGMDFKRIVISPKNHLREYRIYA